MRLRIGHLSTFYHTAVILMADDSVKKKLKMDVDWRLFPTGPAIIDAFGRGEIDMAYIGLPPVLIGIDRGLDIVCVAGGHIEGTVFVGRKELPAFPDEQDVRVILDRLKGKKIGVPGRGSLHDVVLADILEKFELAEKVEVIHFRWADAITEAMARGEVSAAVGTPALAVAVERYAGGKILYPASRLWPHNPSYGIVVDKRFLTEERETVERFLILHEEATSLIRNRPGEVARTVARYVGFIDEEFVMDTLKVSPKYCAQITDEYISSTMEFVKALKRLGYIRRDIDSDGIFDTLLIRRLHPEKDHYGDGIAEA